MASSWGRRLCKVPKSFSWPSHLVSKTPCRCSHPKYNWSTSLSLSFQTQLWAKKQQLWFLAWLGSVLGFLAFILVLSQSHWAAQPHPEHLLPDEKLPPRDARRPPGICLFAIAVYNLLLVPVIFSMLCCPMPFLPLWVAFCNFFIALLLILVVSIFGELMVMQIGEGTDLTLLWPFYGLWVNIILAIIAGLISLFSCKGVCWYLFSRWLSTTVRGILPVQEHPLQGSATANSSTAHQWSPLTLLPSTPSLNHHLSTFQQPEGASSTTKTNHVVELPEVSL